MRAKDVLKLLRITRPTLSKYVKEGIIRTIDIGNGRYDYNDEDIYIFLNGGLSRKTYIYTIGSYKEAVNTSITFLKEFCFNNNLKVNGIFADTNKLNIPLSKRIEFLQLLDEIIDGKVENVVIDSKSQLYDYDYSEYLFKKFNTNIIVMDENIMKETE